MTTALSPVRTPPARRWLEIRQRVLPPLVFIGGIFLAATIWQRAVAPPTFVAEAEVVQSDIRSAQAGTLTSLEVDLLQPVAAGTVVGHVLPADPRVLAASLAMIRAEVEFLQAGLEPVLPGRRVQLDAERLQLEGMRERVALAALRAQLIEAEAGLARLRELRAQDLVAEEVFTTAQNLRDGLTAQVGEQEKLVAGLAPVGPADDAGNADLVLRAAIRVQEEKLRLTEAQLGPVELRAPITGVVSAILRRSGETVTTGEPILRVAATQPARLVGFARQPLTLTPRPGQAVEIRTRTPQRAVAVTTIEQVGAVMEPVSPLVLAALGRAGSGEFGLRVHLRAPAELNLHPGECVDVILRDDDR